MRKIFVLAGLIAALAVPMVAAAATLKAQQSDGFASCPSGSVGTYHFVHNQNGGASSGTLTAIFSNPSGTVTVGNGAPLQANVLHYYVTAEGSLITASDNVAPGNLVLSDFSCTPVKKGGGGGKKG